MQTHAQTEDSTVVFVLFVVGLGKQKRAFKANAALCMAFGVPKVERVGSGVR